MLYGKGESVMIKEIKKGNKASYNGYLLGMHEYEEYQRLKKLVPEMFKEFQQIKGGL